VKNLNRGWYALVLALLGRRVKFITASRRLTPKVLLAWLLLLEVIDKS
jgi:hypothetical protein